ncbi:unnamed protein product [Trichobilharzia szidati]|nr:unnamed protein product [Trichobilharzia szidati]
MHIISSLVLLIFITTINSDPQNDYNQIDQPTIIDTLTFPLVLDEQDAPHEYQQPPIVEHPTSQNLHPPDPFTLPQNDLRQPTRKSRYLERQNDRNEFNYSTFEVGESLCPNVYCFAKRQSLTNELMLDCKRQLSEITDKDATIDCHVWQVPSPGTDTSQSRPSKRHGKGYDLRIVLQPSTVSAEDLSNGNGIKRLRIGQLKPGILEWIVQTVRSSLKMTLSPVHLTISFIYFKKLGRNDLGNLPTKSHVTHLSLWNPFNWDEDSFIPFVDETFVSSNQMSSATETPPYFRLSLFCDYENQNSSFKRLWFPWKSWQLRLNHCPDLYFCRSWYGKQPICDAKQSSDQPNLPMKTFMPSYYISPKSVHNTTQAVKQETGMQILYNNQCQFEADQADPVNDLKFDHAGQCWKTDAYKAVIDSSIITTSIPVIVESSTSPTTSPTTPPQTTEETTATTILQTTPETTASTPLITTTIPTTIESVTHSTIPMNTITSHIQSTISSSDSPTENNFEVFISEKYNDDLLNENTNNERENKEVAFSEQINHTTTVFIAKNQESTVKETTSLGYLTSGLILLGIVNIILLIGFIILVIWIRRRIQKSSKSHPNKLASYGPFHPDFLGTDVSGNNGFYETSTHPLLISTISGTYLSGSHPKLNVRHNSFPDNSTVNLQNADQFLLISNINPKNKNYNYDNSNQSQQHLLGRSTSYSSSMWNGSLRNGLNRNNEKASASNRIYRNNSKDKWDYSSNGFAVDTGQQIQSTPYSSRKEYQPMNSHPYYHKGIKYSSQTLYPSVPSTSCSTSANVSAGIPQRDRERRQLYGSRSRLSSGHPSPSLLHEIRRSPSSSYRRHKKRSISTRPPIGAVNKKPHTLVFENENGNDANNWPENFKTSLHEL